MIQILGVDAASRHTGLALVSLSPTGELAYVGHKAWVDKALIHNTDERVRRTRRLYEDTRAFLTKARVTLAVVEAGFSGRNLRTGLALSAARTATQLALSLACVPQVEVAPMTVKKYVAGHGGASKDDVKCAVLARLNLAESSVSDDVTDALSLAIYGLVALSSIGIVCDRGHLSFDPTRCISLSQMSNAVDVEEDTLRRWFASTWAFQPDLFEDSDGVTFLPRASWTLWKEFVILRKSGVMFEERPPSAMTKFLATVDAPPTRRRRAREKTPSTSKGKGAGQ